MEKLKEYWVIILLVFCFLGLMFYWFEWRIAKIRIDCVNKTEIWNNESTDHITADMIRTHLYVCLMRSGLYK